jgi:spore maturation protein CgeB
MEMTERKKKKSLFNIRYMDVRYVMDVGERDRKKENFTVEFFYRYRCTTDERKSERHNKQTFAL